MPLALHRVERERLRSVKTGTQRLALFVGSIGYLHADAILRVEAFDRENEQ